MTNNRTKLQCRHIHFKTDNLCPQIFYDADNHVILSPKKGAIDLERDKEIKTDIFDLMVSCNQRYQLLINMDQFLQFETIKRLMDIYRLSGVKKLEKFFTFICIFDGQIDLYLKQEILFNLSSKLTLKNGHSIFQSFSNTLFLMLQKAFTNETHWLMFKDNLVLFNEFYNNYRIQQDHKIVNMCQWLKNIIIFGFKKLKSTEPFKKLFNLILNFKEEPCFEELCIFIYKRYNQKLKVKDNLLLLQIIFKGDNDFMDNLFALINDKIELNLKLEACDILYLKGSDKVKIKVKNILENILPDVAYTQNPENVHLSSIHTSIDKTLDTIIRKNKGRNLPPQLFDTLTSLYKPSTDFEKIKGSLNRIFNYNFLKFSKHKLTLKEILENIWLIVDECKPDLKYQLQIRLEQELADMYDTCSQGYVSRLINIFTGFTIMNDDSSLGIAISYEDEIYAMFSTKVNNLVSTAPLNIKEQLIEELIIPSNDHENRLNLIRYLRPFLPQIWNEIFEIFKDELTITDLDLYCRKVTMRYEGC